MKHWRSTAWAAIAITGAYLTIQTLGDIALSMTGAAMLSLGAWETIRMHRKRRKRLRRARNQRRRPLR